MTDLSIIFKHEGTELKVDTSLPVDSFEFNGETYSLDGPILVKGLFRNIGFHKISFDFHAECTINTQCARCLKPVQYLLETEESEILKQADREDINEDSDEIVVSSNLYDMTDVVLNSIMTHMKPKFLCNQDCKGLCPVCGCDLNETSCQCGRDDTDPRLAVLKDLLK